MEVTGDVIVRKGGRVLRIDPGHTGAKKNIHNFVVQAHARVRGRVLVARGEVSEG